VVKSEPLDYADPHIGRKRGPRRGRIIFGALFIISSVVIAICAAVAVEIIKGPWPEVIVLFWPYLAIPAAICLVLAVISAFEFFGAKKR
jgi:hypothetical protein